MPAKPQNKMHTLAFTGTLAPDWGLWKVIDLWETLNQTEPVFLWIAGFCQKTEWLTELKEKIRQSGFSDRIQVLGGDSFVPHSEILRIIALSDAVLAPYQITPAIQDRIPTKFYEAMGLQKPVFFSQNPVWEALNERWHFGKMLPDDTQKAAHLILQSLQDGLQKEQTPESEIWSWKSSEPAFQQFWKQF